jgi:hypothetical protein
MKNINNPFVVIFSIFSKDSNNNELNYILELSELQKKGIVTKPIVLYKNGERELGVMITSTKVSDTELDSPLMDLVRKLCLLYRQEHFLISHGDRSSYLTESRTGLQRYVGTLEEVSSDDILGLSTYIQLGCKYYTTK